MGDTHITGRHFGGDTHITSDMCVGIHISRGYTYHCDTGSEMITTEFSRAHWLIFIVKSTQSYAMRLPA